MKEVQNGELQIEIEYIKAGISDLKVNNEKQFNELKELFKTMQNDINLKISSLDKRSSEMYEYYRVIKTDVINMQRDIATLTARMTAVELEESNMNKKIAVYENGARGVNTVWKTVISFVTGALAVISLVGIILTALGKLTIIS